MALNSADPESNLSLSKEVDVSFAGDATEKFTFTANSNMPLVAKRDIEPQRQEPEHQLSLESSFARASLDTKSQEKPNELSQSSSESSSDEYTSEDYSTDEEDETDEETTRPIMTEQQIVQWAKSQYLKRYCDTNGNLVSPVNFDKFRSDLVKERPQYTPAIVATLKKLSVDNIYQICGRFSPDLLGQFQDRKLVQKMIQSMRPDIDKLQSKDWVKKVEERNIAAAARSMPQSSPNMDEWVREQFQMRYCDKHGKQVGLVNYDKFRKHLVKQKPKQVDAIVEAVKKFEISEASSNGNPTKDATSTPVVAGACSKVQVPVNVPQNVNVFVGNSSLEEWIHKKYTTSTGFTPAGEFRGWLGFTKNLMGKKPKLSEEIKVVVEKLRQSGHKYSLEDPAIVSASKSQTAGPQQATHSQGGVPLHEPAPSSIDDLPPVIPSQTPRVITMAKGTSSKQNVLATNGIIANGLMTPPMDQVSASGHNLTSRVKQLKTPADTPSISGDDAFDTMPILKEKLLTTINKAALEHHYPDYDHIDQLLPDHFGDDELSDKSITALNDIQHAPIVSGDLISNEYRGALPQFGFLGVHEQSKLFLNTNVPFSAFICGVQGSGKSHTTSCLMENALISSKSLGRLENPLSALVFSYGNLTSDGAGLNVSEAAFLGAAHPLFPGHAHVKKITVLYPESNPTLAKIYRKIPKVTTMPFKIKPKHLNITTMLTLMNVDESSSTPLYLAQVTKILRDMAVKGQEGVNYTEFKRRLDKCDFSPAQQQMLDIRLDVLDSFLDLKNTYPEPEYRPGEITIMDMSCPFVDANTACVLFNIGLERYLSSKAAGKMIVLDEAHKYMLKNPGAEALNKQLLYTIRLQRHFGARVVISTQEPTLLTDLIALCSITVIHRFSSPEWFSALKKHIPMSGLDQDKLLQQIESLRTGTGLLYSSNAVLGKNEDGSLVKGTGKLMKVSVRKRVTADGGVSIMAV